MRILAALLFSIAYFYIFDSPSLSSSEKVIYIIIIVIALSFANVGILILGADNPLHKRNKRASRLAKKHNNDIEMTEEEKNDFKLFVDEKIIKLSPKIINNEWSSLAYLSQKALLEAYKK